jgi:outer membrane protein assembly factor BamB
VLTAASVEARRRDERRRRRVRLQRQSLAIVLLAGAAALTALVHSLTGGHSATSPAATARDRTTQEARQPAAVESGLLPWHLKAGLSREVVVPRGPGALVVAGGVTAGGSTAGGIYSLDTARGKLTFLGSLPKPTHDAAAATLGAGTLVLGGGTAGPSAAAQQIPGGGGPARMAAPLPEARADATAVTLGNVAYLIGGYAGSAMDGEVLATRAGGSYLPVARLAVPVRYPAAAAIGGRIYVFGGETVGGRPVTAVQVLLPRAHVSRVVAHLPRPLAGAAAATLDRRIYLAGGITGPRANRPTTAIYAFDPRRGSFLRAGSLRIAVAYAGVAVSGDRLWLVGGETVGERPTADVQIVNPNRRFGIAGLPGAGSPYYGDRLLIADRGNDRLVVLDDTGKTIWTYPSHGRPAPRVGFYFPDDAFFTRHGTAIISNQEDNNTIVEIGYPSGRVLFQYGHPRQAGSQAGYLSRPDDTYLLRNGDITVADASNCRVLIIDPRRRRVVRRIGTAGRCLHRPPVALGSPNGDTPLADGNLLISEVNGSWVDEYTRSGKLVWTAKLPIGYPSDPQQLGRDRYLIADYEDPGAIIEFNRAGRILYRFQPRSAPGKLNHPSLVELLPSGVFMVNDDYNHRMVAIDPATGALVWQYGVTLHPGRGRGFLNTPDGFDLLQPDGKTPTHAATG